MDRVSARLTVFFDAPFWVGVFERLEDGKLSAARVVFGAEPKDSDLLHFVQTRYYSLRFSPAVESVEKEASRNPKRLQREVRRQLQQRGVGTQSQQALKLQHEQNRQERRFETRAQKEAAAQRLFELKQQKKKEKHKGH